MKKDDDNDNVIKLGSTPEEEKKTLILNGDGPSKEDLVEKAAEELDYIRETFIEFQAELEGKALTTHFLPAIEHFAMFASSLDTLLTEDMPKARDDEDAKKKEELSKLKERILISVKNKYFK